MKIEVFTELLAERVSEHFPIEKEPKISTMDKPVIIESACPGWQVGGDRYPAVPIATEDQVSETLDSIKAAAIAIHVHPRDPKTGNAQVNPHMLADIMKPVFDEMDCVTLNHTWAAKEEADYITETEELLELGKGNRDRGRPHGLRPPTPPGIRVRTRRFKSPCLMPDIDQRGSETRAR